MESRIEEFFRPSQYFDGTSVMRYRLREMFNVYAEHPDATRDDPVLDGFGYDSPGRGAAGESGRMGQGGSSF